MVLRWSVKEIGVIGHGTKIYFKSDKSFDVLIYENTENKEKLLRIMYWIPKMQKNSIGACSILASKIFFSKQIF